MISTKRNPSTLFPDWHELSQLQRASVARSALCFGKALGELITAGVRVRVVAPGTSLVRATLLGEKRFRMGRFEYGIRGKTLDGTQVFVGVECIDKVASGDEEEDQSDAVRHELAHCLHRLWLTQAQDDPRIKTRVATIKSLYSEAVAHRNGQSIADSEAHENELEYFAWGCTGDTKGNPKLAKLVKQVFDELSDYPSGFVGP